MGVSVLTDGTRVFSPLKQILLPEHNKKKLASFFNSGCTYNYTINPAVLQLSRVCLFCGRLPGYLLS